MKKQKLVLVFNEDSEVNSFETSYIFDNEKDAEIFLTSYAWFLDVKIRAEEGYFSFKGKSWGGSGKAFWATYI